MFAVQLTDCVFSLKSLGLLTNAQISIPSIHLIWLIIKFSLVPSQKINRNNCDRCIFLTSSLHYPSIVPSICSQSGHIWYTWKFIKLPKNCNIFPIPWPKLSNISLNVTEWAKMYHYTHHINTKCLLFLQRFRWQGPNRVKMNKGQKT